MTGGRVDGFRIEIDRNNVDFGDGDVAGQIVVDRLDGLRPVAGQVRPVAVDAPDRWQEADGAEVLVDFVDRLPDLLGGSHGCGVLTCAELVPGQVHVLGGL